MSREERISRLRHLARVGGDFVRDLVPQRPGFGMRKAYGLEDESIEALLITRERGALVNALGAQARHQIDYARRVARGRFALLGYGEVTLDRPLDYSHDPFSGVRWPARHGMTINYRRGRHGDPKWIWELNRLQHVPTLLCAWHRTADDSYLAVAKSDLTAWHAQTRPGHGVGWANAFEPALRAISLSLSLDALRGAGQGCELLRRQLRASISEHLAWIARYPSRHSSANNHRLAELVSVIVSTALTGDGLSPAEGSGYADELKVLSGRLFYPDGGYAEQSFAYGVFALDLLVLLVATLRGSEVAVPRWLTATIARGERAIAAQTCSGSYVPDYGDRDDGCAFALYGDAARDAESMCRLLRSAAGMPPGGSDVAATWLFGEQSIGGDDSTGAGAGVACEAPSSLPDSGLVIMSTDRTSVHFDVGALGLAPIAAHGHADALQITVRHQDTMIIGDPGTGSYYGSPHVRDAFRGTGFHATVMVDGADQAIVRGAFLWDVLPAVVLDSHDPEHRTASGSHDGYKRLREPVAHTRTVVLVEEGLIAVKDDLVSDGHHVYSQRWPVNPESRLVDSGRGFVRFSGPTEFSITTTVPVTPAVYCGSTSPFIGWWSDRLEAIRPAPTVSVDTSARGPIALITLIACGRCMPVVCRGQTADTTVVKYQDRALEVRWNPSRSDGIQEFANPNLGVSG